MGRYTAGGTTFIKQLQTGSGSLLRSLSVLCLSLALSLLLSRSLASRSRCLSRARSHIHSLFLSRSLSFSLSLSLFLSLSRTHTHTLSLSSLSFSEFFSPGLSPARARGLSLSCFLARTIMLICGEQCELIYFAVTRLHFLPQALLVLFWVMYVHRVGREVSVNPRPETLFFFDLFTSIFFSKKNK